MYCTEYYLAIQATHPYLWRNHDHSTALDDTIETRTDDRPERIPDDPRRLGPRGERSGGRLSAALASMARSGPFWVWGYRTHP